MCNSITTRLLYRETDRECGERGENNSVKRKQQQWEHKHGIHMQNAHLQYFKDTQSDRHRNSLTLIAIQQQQQQ